jgi:hypothetical protein
MPTSSGLNYLFMFPILYAILPPKALLHIMFYNQSAIPAER